MKRIYSFVIALVLGICGLSAQNSVITVDGDFSDWQNVPSNYLAVASADDNAQYKTLYEIRLCSDSVNLYFYLDYSAGSYSSEDAGTGYDVANIDILLNTDGDNTTGYTKDELWSPCGADFLIEGQWADNFTNANAYLFPTGVDQTSWSWEEMTLPTSIATTCTPADQNNNGRAILEGMIQLTSLPAAIKSLQVGVVVYNSQWEMTGLLPQATFEATGGVVTQAMLDVPFMPATLVQDPIYGACGDSVSWKFEPDLRKLTIFGDGTMWNYNEQNPPEYSKYSEMIDTVVVDRGVSLVGDYAFFQLSSLRHAELSSSVQYMGVFAFFQCTNLSYVTLPENLTLLREKTFAGCQNLRNIQFPEGLQIIENEVFNGCYGLKDITVPNSVAAIGQGAFAYCQDLQTITLPGQLDAIESSMLAYCSQLKSISIPSTVSLIGESAFSSCTSLPEITLPANLQLIGNGAFSFCNGLRTITCEAVTPPSFFQNVDNSVFTNVPSSIPLYVPAQSVDKYKQTDGWNYFTHIRAIGDTITESPTVTIGGIEIDPSQTDTTGVVDLNGDGSVLYDPEENTLTLNNYNYEEGEEESVAINYTGDDPLTIVLSDSSSIKADTVIASTADIIITGDGHLVVEGNVPIVGTPESSITFDCNMSVRSVPLSAASRRRHGIKFGKRLDETGGPALSGFGSADFGKVNVSPSDALYGPVNTTDENGEQTTINALYVDNNGEQEVVTEFEVTLKSNDDAVAQTHTPQTFDPAQPMYNILGLPVDATYKGVVIQNRQTFLLQ